MIQKRRESDISTSVFPRVALFALLVGLALTISRTVVAQESQPQAGAGNNVVYLPAVHRAPDNAWPMAAANPERTSWSPEEVRGDLRPVWHRPFEPYILPRVSLIAAYNNIYVATARGLYAIDAATGAQRWVYPTELPLGNAPTVYEGVAYVGGFDKKIHAIDAITGQGLWTFSADAGFDTNPLVINGKLYAGNRNGKFYAIHISGPNTGQVAWQYATGGSIHFSAAYKDGVVYFASNDSHAYALNAQNGQLVWKSAKLPGQGFHNWWPVIYGDYVVFAGSSSYPVGRKLGPGSIHDMDRDTVYPNNDNEPTGKLVGPLSKTPGPWAPGTPTIDTSKSSGTTLPITQYFEQYPWRRTYFVLHRSNGQEYTSDFDNDGQPEYAPILWFGAKGSSNRYPPIVAADGVLYQTNNYMSDSDIAGGQVSGWALGTPHISAISSDWGAVDEPQAYSAGGDLIYWSLCCDRQAASIDITKPNSLFYDNYVSGILPPTAGGDHSREWQFFSYNLHVILPGYNQQYYQADGGVYGVFGDSNGLYGYHGDQNPPIPYKGRVYLHRSNALIAFEAGSTSAQELPMSQTVDTLDSVPVPSEGQLKARLEGEVQKILDAGHLRPGFAPTGLFDIRATWTCGDALIDYFHHPGDTLYTLLRALPHLSPSLQQQTRTYLQNEFAAYPPYQYNHIGWADGAARELFDLPPDVEAVMASEGPKPGVDGYEGWYLNPHFFYSLWKYAEEFGDAQALFNASKDKLPQPPPNSVFQEMPYALNAFIAGYTGYLELEAMAGQGPSTNVENTLNSLLNQRVSLYTIDAPPAYFQQSSFQKWYCRTLNASRNFIYLVPETADHLRTNALGQVQQTLNTYDYLAPYWMVPRVETVIGEGTLAPLYDSHSILHARAWILQEPRSQLVKYLDVPSFAVGDLFYINNLITVIEAAN